MRRARISMNTKAIRRKVSAMQRTTTSRTITATLVAFLLGVCLLACAGCASTFTIGTDSEDAVKISAKNETGQAITALAVKSTLAEDFSDALEQSGDWASDATAELYLDPAIIEVTSEKTVEGENATVTEEQDVILEPRTDIRITTADGMTYELHQLNIEDIKDATVKLEGDTAYLVYTSIATGEEVDTLEAEQAYRDQQKAAAEAEQAANQQEQQQAGNNAQAASLTEKSSNGSSNAGSTSNKSTSSSSASKSTSDSSKSSNSSSSSSSGNSSSSASSGEDACVDDLVLN